MPHLRGLGVSEPGMADNQFIRYFTGLMPGWPFQRCWAEVLWVEFKKPKKEGGNTARHQKEWHQMERSRGGLVWVLGEDFEASIESFCKFYAASGLQRKSISIPR